MYGDYPQHTELMLARRVSLLTQKYFLREGVRGGRDPDEASAEIANLIFVEIGS
jgi:hypothetical protein